MLCPNSSACDAGKSSVNIHLQLGGVSQWVFRPLLWLPEERVGYKKSGKVFGQGRCATETNSYLPASAAVEEPEERTAGQSSRQKCHRRSKAGYTKSVCTHAGIRSKKEPSRVANAVSLATEF